MKKLILIFISTIFAVLIMSWLNTQPKYEISSREKAVNTAIGRNIKLIQDKYNLRPFGTTVAMPEGDIQYLELEFQIYGPLAKPSIRQLLISIAHDFLSDLNNDVELCFFLKNGKLNINEIGIGLFVIDKCGRGLDHPNIAIASISKGKLEYLTLANNEENFRDFVTEEEESFEEALQILQQKTKCTAVHKRCNELPI